MTPEKKYMGIVAAVGCVLCREQYGCIEPCEVHHIAEGSGIRSDYMTVGLCPRHHRIELHGGGIKAFLARYHLATEYHLLGLVNKYRIKDGV